VRLVTEDDQGVQVPTWWKVGWIPRRSGDLAWRIDAGL
jgi:hypothetical protein